MKTYKDLASAAGAFRTEVFEKDQQLYSQLSRGQKPGAAFIGCSDSRIIPNLLTDTAPGELFVLRNAGNLIARADRAGYSEAASLEYAVQVLKVADIVVCGHTQCGAVHFRLENADGEGQLPYVSAWVRQAADLRERMKDKAALSPEERWRIAVQENVRVQLEHLCTYPFVKAAIEEKRLSIHGWVFELETGDVLAIDGPEDEFRRLGSPGASRSRGRSVASGRK